MQDHDNTGEGFLEQGGYVYFIQSADGLSVKIGFSSSVTRRFAELDSSQGAIRLIGYMPGTRRTEQWLHAKFRVDRKVGEWFVYSAALRAFINGLGLIGSAMEPSSGRYRRKRNTDMEDEATDKVLVEKLMQVARGEVRRYLHSIIVAAVPEWRRKAHSERITAALAKSKQNGTRLGRAPVIFDSERVRALRLAGKSVREIAGLVGVSRGTVHRFLQRPEIKQ